MPSLYMGGRSNGDEQSHGVEPLAAAQNPRKQKLPVPMLTTSYGDNDRDGGLFVYKKTLMHRYIVMTVYIRGQIKVMGKVIKIMDTDLSEDLVSIKLCTR